MCYSSPVTFVYALSITTIIAIRKCGVNEDKLLICKKTIKFSLKIEKRKRNALSLESLSKI
jgi:hypothetical protein